LKLSKETERCAATPTNTIHATVNKNPTSNAITLVPSNASFPFDCTAPWLGIKSGIAPFELADARGGRRCDAGALRARRRIPNWH